MRLRSTWLLDGLGFGVQGLGLRVSFADGVPDIWFRAWRSVCGFLKLCVSTFYLILLLLLLIIPLLYTLTAAVAAATPTPVAPNFARAQL